MGWWSDEGEGIWFEVSGGFENEARKYEGIPVPDLLEVQLN